MKFGVNYTPSHGWFHAWLDPDWDGIDNDLKIGRASCRERVFRAV